MVQFQPKFTFFCCLEQVGVGVVDHQYYMTTLA